MVHIKQKRSLKTTAVLMRYRVKAVIQSGVAATSHHLGFAARRSPTHFSPCLCLRCSFWDAMAWCMSPQPLGWPDSLFYAPITRQPEVPSSSNLWKLPTLSRCPWDWLPGCAHFCGLVWSTRGRSPAVWRSWLCSHSRSARLSEEAYDV